METVVSELETDKDKLDVFVCEVVGGDEIIDWFIFIVVRSGRIVLTLEAVKVFIDNLGLNDELGKICE